MTKHTSFIRNVKHCLIHWTCHARLHVHQMGHKKTCLIIRPSHMKRFLICWMGHEKTCLIHWTCHDKTEIFYWMGHE